MGSRITLLRPGTVAYHDALALQHRAADGVRAGGDETLILLEHPPTYTLGARGKHEHLLLSLDAMRARGAGVVQTDRGGDVTFHGPGQIVGYPIVDLRARGIGPATYVRSIEQVLIEALASFGIAAVRVDGRPGVWTDGAKIAAIGVRVSRGVTTHGFALNVNTDLSWFDHIVPCGITDASVTSMQRIAGREIDIRNVEDAVVAAFARVFGVEGIETVASDRSDVSGSSHEFTSVLPLPTTGRGGRGMRVAGGPPPQVASKQITSLLPLSTQMERGPGGEVHVGR